ncbi:MAG TPA: DUF5020 family protein [Puia sp.]|nr:DUF5020 family protein [Puia sp.]
MSPNIAEFRHNSVAIPAVPISFADLPGKFLPIKFWWHFPILRLPILRFPTRRLPILLLPALLPAVPLSAQNLQLHYDLRHTVDPEQNPHNFPTLYVEYFKQRDSGDAIVKFGGFLFKAEADFVGPRNNIGKWFCQVAQSFRAWHPKIFLHGSYSGGAGVTEPRQYSYYITNTFQAGAEIPFRWKGIIFSSVLDYKYVAYAKPSNDPIYTLYWWRGLLHYRVELAGDINAWTENRNHGDPSTVGESGKRFFFFAEPQLWLNVGKSVAVGSKINLYYHVNTTADRFQVYPTVAVKIK